MGIEETNELIDGLISKLHQFFKVLWIWVKSFFINKNRVANKLTDSAFKIFPYPVKRIFNKEESRIYEFSMPNDWILMGSLKDGEMKLLMRNGKDQTNRTLKIAEWSNKTTLFGVINSMQVSLRDKEKKSA